jgi:hypothetical protein
MRLFLRSSGCLSASSLINSDYEYVALHRDVGETELKQGREIKAGGTLEYVDSAAVRAAKHGRILILEGIEKAERGIMPVGVLNLLAVIPRPVPTASFLFLALEQPLRK